MFKKDYPQLHGCLLGLAKTLVVGASCGIAIVLYGNMRYNDGVKQGRAQHLCETFEALKIKNIPAACIEWLKNPPHLKKSAKNNFYYKKT